MINNMKKFRLPRKAKKKIKKGLYFYPMDPFEKTFLSAFPRENQEDFDAFMTGKLLDFLTELKKLNNESKTS